MCVMYLNSGGVRERGLSSDSESGAGYGGRFGLLLWLSCLLLALVYKVL